MHRNDVAPGTYSEDYYRTSNYADYLERADRYRKTANELADLLQKLSLIDRQSVLLDYGCAVGFLMEGFKELGFQRIHGFEVSEWATKEGRARGNCIQTDLNRYGSGNWDVMFAMDVFEHMSDEQIDTAISHLNPKAMVVRIPSSTDGGQTFHLEVSRADPTHINCKTKEQWIQFFRNLGYKTFLRLNLFTVYDTPGVTCLLIL